MASPLDSPVLTGAEVRRILGDLTDATVEAIIGTGADSRDLEMVLAWEDVEADGEDEKFLSGPAAAVVDILIEDAGADVEH